MKSISSRQFVSFRIITITQSLLLLLAAFSAGCSNSPQPTASTNKGIKTVAFIPNTSSDFWKIARKGCEKADQELTDVKVTFKTPYDGTPAAQNQLIRQALDGDDASAIAISPIDPVAQKQAINLAAKRVLVITQDSDAPDSDRSFYLGADNRAAGQQAGELMKKALPQGGKIMVFVGKRELQNSQERFEGLKQSLQNSKVEIVDLLTDDNDPTKARGNALDTLKNHPEVNGMIGLWSYNGPAILQAVKSENKVGKIKIVCFDDENETLEGIKDGSIYGTVAQQPFEYGYKAVQLTAKVLSGDRSVIPESKKIFIPTIVVTHENVDEHTSKLKQLLGT